MQWKLNSYFNNYMLAYVEDNNYAWKFIYRIQIKVRIHSNIVLTDKGRIVEQMSIYNLFYSKTNMDMWLIAVSPSYGVD